MPIRRYYFICIIGITLAFSALPLIAADNAADLFAQSMLSKSGIRVGVCEIPRVGDGKLSMSLAKIGVPIIHALAPDAKSLDSARKPSADAGLLGSQVIIEIGTPANLPLGDWVADLYLATDATDANLKALPAEEAARVLSPYRGVAVVGNPAGSRGKLSKAALAAWAKAAGGVATITEDATGLWAVVKMPPLVGGDDWGHYWHGADGNPVSKDTAIVGSRYQMQWDDTPIQGDRNYTMVAAAGRLFVAKSELINGQVNLIRPQKPYELEARSLYNAKILWRHPISSHFGDMGSLLVATPDRLYAKEGTDVLVLDAETGNELHRIQVTATPRVVRWIVHANGVLLTLAGPTPYSTILDSVALPGEAETDRLHRLSLKSIDSESCQELVAWDAVSAKELWRFKEDRIMQRKLAVSNGKVFLSVNDKYVTALDLQSGKPLWKTDLTASKRTFTALASVDQDRRGEMLATASGKAYLLVDSQIKQWLAFDAGDGHQLWDLAEKNKKLNWWNEFSFPMIIGDAIRYRGGEVRDIASGDPIKGVRGFDQADSCGHSTVVESGLWIGGGIWDMNSGKQLVPQLFKAGCGLGAFVAGGTEVMYPSCCNCAYWWKGMSVIRATPQRPVREGIRLEQVAVQQRPPTTPATKTDWPTYRADETRKGSSAAVVATNADIRWTYIPPRPTSGQGAAPVSAYQENEIAATQPIAVAERIWFGTSEGAIVCLDRKTGSEHWRYWTAGRIRSSPSWADGRIYAGSADGWVYCLAADTGALCWRYRVAPEERRITLFGGLGSAWPVWSSVLVYDGVAYAAAGNRGMLDGSALCALDAVTGAVRWQQVFQNTGNTDAKGAFMNEAPSGGGQLAWYGGKLWWNGTEWGAAVVDPTNGNLKRATDFPACNNFQDASAQDIGILPGGWVAIGGFPPARGGAMDFTAVMGGYGMPSVLLRSGPDGVPSFLSKTGATDVSAMPQFWRFTGPKDENVANEGIGRSRINRQMPIWDEQDILLPGDFNKEHRGPLFCHGLTDALTAADDARPFKVTDIHNPSYLSLEHTPIASYTRLFSPFSLAEDKRRLVLPDTMKDLTLSGQMLLAGNAVVLTAARDNNYLQSDLTNWRVIAVNRADRSLLWEVCLPESPSLNGLSLTRDGDVLVPLIDGRVVCIGMDASEQPQTAVTPANTLPGLLARGYASDAYELGFVQWTPADFAIMVPAKTFVVTELRMKAARSAEQTVVYLNGFLEVPVTGVYHFAKKEDNGSWGTNSSLTLYDATGRFVVGGVSLHLSVQSRSEGILLEKGKHPISAIILQGVKGMNCNMQWEGPGLPLADIPASAFSHS